MLCILGVWYLWFVCDLIMSVRLFVIEAIIFKIAFTGYVCQNCLCNAFRSTCVQNRVYWVGLADSLTIKPLPCLCMENRRWFWNLYFYKLIDTRRVIYLLSRSRLHFPWCSPNTQFRQSGLGDKVKFIILRRYEMEHLTAWPRGERPSQCTKSAPWLWYVTYKITYGHAFFDCVHIHTTYLIAHGLS